MCKILKWRVLLHRVTEDWKEWAAAGTGEGAAGPRSAGTATSQGSQELWALQESWNPAQAELLSPSPPSEGINSQLPGKVTAQRCLLYFSNQTRTSWMSDPLPGFAVKHHHWVSRIVLFLPQPSRRHQLSPVHPPGTLVLTPAQSCSSTQCSAWHRATEPELPTSTRRLWAEKSASDKENLYKNKQVKNSLCIPSLVWTGLGHLYPHILLWQPASPYNHQVLCPDRAATL